MYLAWLTNPDDAEWPYLRFCVYQQQSHPCIIHLSIVFPSLKDGDGVGCTHASFRKFCGISGFCKQFLRAWNDRNACRKYATRVVKEARSSYALPISFLGCCTGNNSVFAIRNFNAVMMKNNSLTSYKED